MNKIKSLLTNKTMWIGVAVGVVLALAYRRFFKAIVPVTNKLPGSDASTKAAA